MAPFIELSDETIRQEKLRQLDRDRKPYDIFGQGKSHNKKLPPCLTVMDELLDEDCDFD
jgi:hypothetical protein